MLQFARAASGLGRELDGSNKDWETRKTEFTDAHDSFQDVVFDNRPFYNPPIYDVSKNMLSSGRRLLSRIRKTNIQPSDDKIWEEIEGLNDKIGDLLNEACEQIRERIWLEKRAATTSAESQTTAQ